MWSVFFVFLSYLDRNVVEGALDTEESEQTLSALNGTLCAKMPMAGGGFLYQVSDGAQVVRSVVSAAGKLVDCSITVKHDQVEPVLQECAPGMRAQTNAPFTHMDRARAMCREFTERTHGAKMDTGDGMEMQDDTLKRTKRGFTYPGTLWCGAGNMADTYDQLGQFAETDSCCRIHDHCPHVIHAFSSKYGHTNFKWHSICHCDCDNALKACLRKVNDSSSRVIGQAFFNVIGVPCFDFTYEQQCAERHWYGMCKQYEQVPIAVLREAVPYDFGGIRVIGELTAAPAQTKDLKNSEREEKPERPPYPPTPGLEEPSLRNVVTVAEDFIKVIATVSTSQRSNPESDKSDEQSSEKKKKKRKNPGKSKKTSKKTKGRGKGRKRKQKGGVAREEGAGGKEENMKTLSNLLNESRRHHRVGGGEFELEGKDEPSNEVMKDQPATEELLVSTTSAVTDLKGREDALLPMATVAPQNTKNRPRKWKSDTRRKTRPPGTEKLGDVFVHIDVSTTEPPEHRSLMEMRLAVTAGSPPTVKRNRSKEAGGREKRRNGSKGSSAVPLELSATQSSTVDDVEEAPPTGTPAVPPVAVTERLLSPPHSIQATAIHRDFSTVKGPRSKEKRLRKRRRRPPHPPPSENPPLSWNGSENVLPIPDVRVAPKPSESTTERPGETPNAGELFTTTTLTAVTRRHRQDDRKQTKPGENAGPGALRDGTSDTTQTQTVTSTATPFTAATTGGLRSEKPRPDPTFSPVHWTIQRAREQFARKKRRKAAMLKRRQ